MRHNVLLPLMLALLLALAGIAAARDDGLNIVATTTQSTDIATILTEGVNSVTVTGLMGAGVDPHLYQPTEADITAMNEADMVVYSGLNLEGQFDAVFNALGEQGVAIVPMGQFVKDAGFIIVGEFKVADD
ncbi:MAG: zinc ABC transporter substrate-binding protein, partial [Chloroflexota bacterium]